MVKKPTKFCYVDTETSLVYIKTDDIIKTLQKMLQ